MMRAKFLTLLSTSFLLATLAHAGVMRDVPDSEYGSDGTFNGCVGTTGVTCFSFFSSTTGNVNVNLDTYEFVIGATTGGFTLTLTDASLPGFSFAPDSDAPGSPAYAYGVLFCNGGASDGVPACTPTTLNVSSVLAADPTCSTGAYPNCGSVSFVINPGVDPAGLVVFADVIGSFNDTSLGAQVAGQPVVTATITPNSSVPEPGTLPVLGGIFAVVAAVKRRAIAKFFA
jgi:hypothetical protein